MDADVVELSIGSATLTAQQAERLAGLAKQTEADAGAPFEPDTIDALNILSETNQSEFQRLRKALKAKEVGCSLTALDKAMAARRRADPNRDDDRQGQRLQLLAPEPLEEAVSGEWLLHWLELVIRYHVVLTDPQATAAALWSIHTHLLDIANHSPRLHIDSPVAGCGKSNLLLALEPLVFKPLLVQHVTPAAMFRVIDLAHPTMLIDEGDTFLKDNEDMRSLLDASYQPSGSVLRVVGDDFEVRAFKVYSAVAIAGIGKIPYTIEERSITIHLRKRLAAEKVARMRDDQREHLAALGRAIARWVLDNRQQIVDPVLPERLSDRERDNWRPLIAIADAISPEAGASARAAALTLSADEEKDDEDIAGIMALTDIAAAFGRTDADYILSEDLVKTFCEDFSRPWSEWRRGKALTQNSLARLLKAFSIKPLAIKKAKNQRGYERAPVEEAKRRYLDRAEPGQPSVGVGPVTVAREPAPAKARVKRQTKVAKRRLVRPGADR